MPPTEIPKSAIKEGPTIGMSAKVRSKSFAMAIARAWPPIPTSHDVPWGVAVLFTITLQNQQRNLQDVVKNVSKTGGYYF